MRLECFSPAFFMVVFGALNGLVLLATIAALRAEVDEVWRYPHMVSGAVAVVLLAALAPLTINWDDWLSNPGVATSSMLMVLAALATIWGAIQGWRTRRDIEYRRRHALLCLIGLGVGVATLLADSYFYL